MTIPRYGSVESYARILRGARADWLELSALAIVRIIVDDECWPDADKIDRIRNLVTAAEQVRSATPMPSTTGLDYSRPADDPTPVSPARVPLHTGAVTDEGLVDEVVHISLVGNKTQCGLKVGDLPPGHSVVDSWAAPSTCKVCGDEEPF